jgi:protein-tyrosine-phosphatase
MGKIPSEVLFACTMNSVRSPIAEGVMRHLHARHVYVDSAGAREGKIDSFAIAVMNKIGIDLSRHHSKTFEDLEDSSFDVVISLSPEAQHKAVEMTRVMACEVELWNTFDPTIVEGSRETRLDAFWQVRDELTRRIKEQFPIITVVDV